MMEYFRRTAFQIICLTTTANAAVSVDESPTDLFVRRIRDVEEEETEFEGDVALADEDERELDLIFAETLRGSGRKRDQDKKARKQKMKKTKHVLRMLKFAQPERRSRDWLEYGCYCFADVKSDILTPGVGKAIDPIDQACRTLTDCLKCSEFDYGLSRKCNPHVGYKFESLNDVTLGLRSITCLDKLDSCQRSMCECDRQFLQSIQEAEYDRQYSGRTGFKKDEQCPKRVQREQEGKTGENNNGKSQLAGRMNSLESDAPQQCCGPLGQRHLIKVTPTRGCCGQQTFNPFLFDCCAGGTVEPIGAC